MKRKVTTISRSKNYYFDFKFIFDKNCCANKFKITFVEKIFKKKF